jgi:hypothetical protein
MIGHRQVQLHDPTGPEVMQLTGLDLKTTPSVVKRQDISLH